MFRHAYLLLFDVIEANYIINEHVNPSSHNLVLTSMTCFIHDKLFVNRLVPNNIHVRESMYAWNKSGSCLINFCLEVGLETIPLVIPNGKTIPGWSVNVKHNL